MKKVGTILGIIAGGLGIIGAIFLFLGWINTLNKVENLVSHSMIISSFILLALAVLGIVMSIHSKKNAKKSGVIIIIDALIGMLFGPFYIASSILFIISGVLILISNKQNQAMTL
jgi:nitrate reductase gamma subunit